MIMTDIGGPRESYLRYMCFKTGIQNQEFGGGNNFMISFRASRTSLDTVGILQCIISVKLLYISIKDLSLKTQVDNFESSFQIYLLGRAKWMKISLLYIRCRFDALEVECSSKENFPPPYITHF